MSTEDALAEILTILKRMEERQKATTKIVEEIEEHEPKAQGSFGSVDLGEQK